MSWQTKPRRVSVLAEMALRREKIAERLTELREHEGLSQERAAGKVGVTLRQWQRWEAGESVPYPRNLDAVASKFGLSIEEFFDEHPSGPTARVTLLEARVIDLERLMSTLLKREPLTPEDTQLIQDLEEIVDEPSTATVDVQVGQRDA